MRDSFQKEFIDNREKTSMSKDVFRDGSFAKKRGGGRGDMEKRDFFGGGSDRDGVDKRKGKNKYGMDSDRADHGGGGKDKRKRFGHDNTESDSEDVLSTLGRNRYQNFYAKQRHRDTISEMYDE